MPVNNGADRGMSRGFVQQLLRDVRGSALPLMVAGLIPAIAALGSAIDAGRMYIVKSQLQAGVDAAALAGARAFQITDTTSKSRTAQVTAYFEGNFSRSPAYMGVSGLLVTPNFSVVNGINVTTVTAQATLPMSFMRLFGFDTQVMRATAKAELQPRPMEVMVVLDNTGSMRTNLSAGRTRMTALKEATVDFVDILHQGGAQRRDLALGFIPYDVTVNVGHLLRSALPGAVASLDGFNSGYVGGGGNWPSNPYAWKGCVMNDSTVRDVSADRTVSEAGAWDVTRVLPGEAGNPAVQPYFIPPMYVPLLASGSDTAAERANPTGDYYRIANVEPDNNLYRLDNYGASAALMANSAAYRQYFYDYYIGLNNGSGTSGDDVIVQNGGGYYNPGSGGNWTVEYSRLPRYNDATFWKAPSDATVNSNGGRVDNINADTTPMPSPNWQCPEEAMPVAYNRPKSAYNSYISDENAAIYPANGTIHHSGLLWGYRLLVRSDVFTRTNPTNEQPRRAIVFMTDGLNEVGETQNGYTSRTFTWYGRWSDAKISATASNAETQMLRRFSKTCANIQREANPPEVYIIALVANSTAVNTAFDQCAPGRVYRTSTTAGLRAAFQDVASELVDLHLVQ